MEQLRNALPSFFLFAITWSIGGTCDAKGREAFDQHLRTTAAGDIWLRALALCPLANPEPTRVLQRGLFFVQLCSKKLAPNSTPGQKACLQSTAPVFWQPAVCSLSVKMFCTGLKDCQSAQWPSEKTVYDWTYSLQNAGWVEWMSTVPPFTPEPDVSFSQIIVPTSDTVRYNYLLKILAFAGKHVLFVGYTGSGKSCWLLLFKLPRLPAVSLLVKSTLANTSLVHLHLCILHKVPAGLELKLYAVITLICLLEDRQQVFY